MTDTRGARRRERTVSCQEALEAVSARLDDEQVPIGERELKSHLASCATCRNFEAQAATLGRQLRLRLTRPVPEDLVPKLMPFLEPRARPFLGALKGPFAPSRRPGFAGRAQLAGATMSVALAVVGLSLGVGSHPRLVPTRPPSACTVGLSAHHLRGGS
ncbi:MAG TPA: zf-HC2 domain-containing protein [Acidimicrobiales bacterium]|nr:zf-HC2 domain-containing protein [Acidimicrobiales bacterium]